MLVATVAQAQVRAPLEGPLPDASGQPLGVPQASPLPRILPPSPPRVAPGLAPTFTPPVNTVPPTPTAVSDVAVEGATAFPASRLQPLLSGLIGPATPQSRIEAARLALLKRYRDSGYVFTRVDAALHGGHLRFIVAEGYIAEVKLNGNIGPAGSLVLRLLNHVVDQRPIDIATLERWLLLAQDVPGVTLRASLQPSGAEPEALTLIATLSRAPVSGLVTADNRAFRKTGPEEGLGVVDFNSFTSLGERTEISMFGAFDGTQVFGEASTEVHIGASGLRLKFYGGAGRTTPSDDLAAIGYDGVTNVFGAQLTYPLIRSRQQTLNLVGVFDAIESDVFTNTGTGGASARASADDLRVLRVGADYSLQDTVFGGARPATNLVSVRLSRGLSGLGASANGRASAARVNERVDFTKGAIEVSREQTLFSPWDNATVTLLGLVAGQATGEVLPPAEEFYLGGARFTRGFYSGEVTGDNALAATVELRLNTSFQVPVFGRQLDIGTQFYGFFDWGETWQNQKLDLNQRLRSAGGGVRATVTQYTEFDVEAVARATRRPDGGGSTVFPLSASAVYWRVLTRF